RSLAKSVALFNKIVEIFTVAVFCVKAARTWAAWGWWIESKEYIGGNALAKPVAPEEGARLCVLKGQREPRFTLG
ncbi:MAG: hypothetical protein U0805_19070, partial [Pirellulales bacterium]